MPKLTTNGWTTREALMDREPFDTYGALSAVSGYVLYTGQLPEPWATQYRNSRDHITYTVMSYQTPIAWVLDDGTVVIPRELSGRNQGQPVKYSRTTSGHQGLLYALDKDRLSQDSKAGIRESAQRERQSLRDRRNRSRERATEVHTASYARIEHVRDNIGIIFDRVNNRRAADAEPYQGTYRFRSTPEDYDALIAEVGELSRPVR